MNVVKYFFAIVLISYVVLINSTFGDRPTIAVLDFKTSSYSMVIEIQIGKDVVRYKWSDAETSLFTSDLITNLVNTRKFDVVERDRMRDVLREQDFSDTGLVATEKSIKMGQLIGATYFVMGNIELIEAGQKETKIPYSDYTKTELRGRMIVNMRIVDTRGGKIVAAKKVNVEEVQKMALHDPLSPQAFMELLKEKAVKLLVNEVVEGVFPIKIVKIVDNQIFLNRGEGDIFNVGNVMNVYNVGEELIDPDTNESLGMAEIEVGRIKITEIQPKFSKAQVVEGEVGRIIVGAICRLIQEMPQHQMSEPKTPGSSEKPIQW